MAEPDLAPSLSERLGGRWAISWQAFALSVPLAALAVAASASSDPGRMLSWFGITLIALVAVGAWTYLMHRTVFRNRVIQPVPLPWVYASAVIAGLILIAVTGALGYVTGVNDTDTFIPSPVLALIFATVWGLAIALVLESQWRFRVQREVLVDQAVQRRLIQLQELDVLDQLRQRTDAEVAEELAPVRRRLEERIDSLISEGEAELGGLADDLRTAADRTIRPLSHRLEEESRRAHPAPRLASVIRNIARYQPFRPVAVGAIYVLLAVPSTITMDGVRIGLGLSALTLALILITMSLVNVALRRWPRHHTVLFIAGLVFVQVPTVALNPLVEQVTGRSITVAQLAATCVLGTIFIVATSAFGARNRTREEALRQFAAEIREDEITEMARGKAIADIAREAARILHGSVQSQLRACAAALDAAAETGDTVGINRALVQARAILEQPLPIARTSGDRRLGALVEDKASEWQSLVTVTMAIDPSAAQIDGLMADHVGAIVEEGIANAVHHGQSRTVDVRIASADDQLTVTITDDGRGPQGGSPGLGSRLMSGFDGRWSLRAADSGSILTVTVPTAIRVD